MTWRVLAGIALRSSMQVGEVVFIYLRGQTNQDIVCWLDVHLPCATIVHALRRLKLS